MSLWVCAGCSTRYASGLLACPHCGSPARAGGEGGAPQPYLEVACGTPECAAYAEIVRVLLRRAAPGVVEMPGVLVCEPCGRAMGAVRSWEDDMWQCGGCQTTYRVRLSRCPRCHGTEGGDVPKATRHGGATNAAAGGEEGVSRPPSPPVPVEETEPTGSDAVAAVEHEVSPDPAGPVPVAAGDLGGALTDEQVEKLAAAAGGHRMVVLGEEESSPGSSSETSQPKPPSPPATSESDPPQPAPKTASRSKRARTGSSTAPSTGGSGKGEQGE